MRIINDFQNSVIKAVALDAAGIKKNDSRFYAIVDKFLSLISSSYVEAKANYLVFLADKGKIKQMVRNGEGEYMTCANKLMMEKEAGSYPFKVEKAQQLAFRQMNLENDFNNSLGFSPVTTEQYAHDANIFMMKAEQQANKEKAYLASRQNFLMKAFLKENQAKLQDPNLSIKQKEALSALLANEFMANHANFVNRPEESDQQIELRGKLIKEFVEVISTVEEDQEYEVEEDKDLEDMELISDEKNAEDEPKIEEAKPQGWMSSAANFMRRAANAATHAAIAVLNA